MLTLTDLDDENRRLMRAEIEADIAGDTLYISPRLSPRGIADYPTLLLEAADSGTDASLALELRALNRLKTHEESIRNGKPYTKSVPVNAAETLSEGEFNRYHARAVCIRAIAEESKSVQVYRAKEVVTPRQESEDLIGHLINADELLTKLRTSPGVDVALGVHKPNSGLSVKRS